MNRREFLRRLGIGAASVVASQALPEAEAKVETPAPMKPFNYGVTYAMSPYWFSDKHRAYRMVGDKIYYSDNFFDGVFTTWQPLDNDAGE